MKRLASSTLVAAAAFSSHAVWAQSSVTVYGQMDLGIQYLTHAGANGSSVSLQSGNLIPSFWGVLGREDLGAGYAAIFRLESGINIANGAQINPNSYFNRYAFVGLDTPYGRFTAGQQFGVLFDQTIEYDPTFLAQFSLLSTGLLPLDTLTSGNSIKWVSPKSWGGFTGEAMYSLGQQVPGHMASGTYLGGSVGYTFKSLSSTITYEQTRGSIEATVDTSSDIDRRVNIDAKYAFDKLAVMGGYANVSGNLQLSPDGNYYYGGLRYRATPAVLAAAEVVHYSTHNNQGSPTWYVLEGAYSLSKRTTLYAFGGVLANHGGKGFTLNAYDFSSPGGISQTGVQVGISHLF
jgi:predicted porin